MIYRDFNYEFRDILYGNIGALEYKKSFSVILDKYKNVLNPMQEFCINEKMCFIETLDKCQNELCIESIVEKEFDFFAGCVQHYPGIMELIRHGGKDEQECLKMLERCTDYIQRKIDEKANPIILLNG